MRTVIMGAFVAASAVAQESPPTEWNAARLQFDGQVEMFNLYTHCRPLYINATVNEEAEGIGVSPDSVHAAVEGRLRSRGLYQPEFVFPSSLGVKVNVVGDAFRIDVELQRLVYNLIQEPTVNNVLLREMVGDLSEEQYQVLDERRAEGAVSPRTYGEAITWTLGYLGTHEEDASRVRSALNEVLDIFISDYARVNEPACG